MRFLRFSPIFPISGLIPSKCSHTRPFSVQNFRFIQLSHQQTCRILDGTILILDCRDRLGATLPSYSLSIRQSAAKRSRAVEVASHRGSPGFGSTFFGPASPDTHPLAHGALLFDDDYADQNYGSSPPPPTLTRSTLNDPIKRGFPLALPKTAVVIPIFDASEPKERSPTKSDSLSSFPRADEPKTPSPRSDSEPNKDEMKDSQPEETIYEMQDVQMPARSPPKPGIIESATTFFHKYGAGKDYPQKKAKLTERDAVKVSAPAPMPPVEAPAPAPVALRGLENLMGENNCFLNVVIQSLWHLRAFSSAFVELTQHTHSDNCVVCELQSIYTQFQFAEDHTIPPRALRQALAALHKAEARFQIGSIDDATEAFVRHAKVQLR